MSLPNSSDLLTEIHACSSESYITANDTDENEPGSDNSENDPPLEIPSHISELSDNLLKEKLIKYGVSTGPAFRSLRKLYEKKLTRLEMKLSVVKPETGKPKYSVSLERLLNMDERREILELGELEEEAVRKEFVSSSIVNADKEASSFCYLLIDPSKIRDVKTTSLREFIAAIFYVGQGKRSRPLKHLRISTKGRKINGIKSEKDRHVLKIWDRGIGVISLHICTNIYETEAFIREAAMIDTIGLNNLTNRCIGTYYGVSKSWSQWQKTNFGARLLKNAYVIFKHERCRPLFEHELGIRNRKPTKNISKNSPLHQTTTTIATESPEKYSAMSDEDDYMSESFLSTVKDVAPGVSSLPSQRRVLKLNARKEFSDEYVRSLPKKVDIEKQRREEALNKPLGEESKGFALLAKMGYKPGMSLGKQREGTDSGIKVPIRIEMKAGKSGLGHETHEKEQQQIRCEAHLKRMEFQAKNQHILLKDYRKRKRDLTAMKELIGDVARSRKACQELDIRQGRSLPEDPYFWAIYAEKQDQLAAGEESGISFKSFKRNGDDSEDDSPMYHYVNGQDAPPEENLNDIDEDELLLRLVNLTEYLRGAHHYCVWCGCAYDSLVDLSNQCPGPTRKDHDE